MIKDGFKDAHESSKAAFERENEIRQSPVSKGEMEALIALRSQPKLEYNLRPDGQIEQTINQRMQVDNERRIGYIRERLNRMEGRAKDDFERPH